MTSRRSLWLAVLVGTLFGCQTALAGDVAGARKRAMAMETVRLAQTSCGYELTPDAGRLIADDQMQDTPSFADERAVLANLWRETWRCNAAFTGDNCMAARWQLCRQAYAEYGPEGIRVRGLIRAIIKK